MDVIVKGLRINAQNDRTKRLLDNVNVEFAAGQITLIVGKTGAGKSTLLEAITGLVPIDAGTVRFAGRTLWEQGKWRAKRPADAGIVFQRPEHYLFARKVEAEFRYTLRHLRLSREAAEQRIRESLAAVGLPYGIRSRNPLLLSGGQKRKVAIATAIAARPRWLVLDEPSAGLDAEGWRALRELLLAWKREGGGVIVATHDLDRFLPLADKVVVLQAATVAVAIAPAALAECPELLTGAGIGLPAGIRAAEALRAAGLPVPRRLWSAEGLAEAAAALLPADAPAPASSGASSAAPPGSLPLCGEAPSQGAAQGRQAALLPADAPAPAPLGASPAAPPGSVPLCGEAPSGAAQGRQAASACRGTADDPPPKPAGFKRIPKPASGGVSLSFSRRIKSLDPRALWLFYVFVSAGMLIQRSPAGLAASTLIAVSLTAVAGISLRALLQPVRFYALFMVFSAVVAGLRLPAGAPSGAGSAFGFELSAAVGTLQSLYPVLPALLVGVLLTQVTTSLRLKQGLLQGLAPLRRFGFPVESFALTVSLMFRFIPILLAEWSRFGKIARARGKSRGKPGALKLRELPAVAVPLLLSMLSLAEELALAMELKGYGRAGNPGRPAAKPGMTRADYAAVGTGSLILALLLLLRSVF
jgi:energy-coupling factor transport system ATP-binding protein